MWFWLLPYVNSPKTKVRQCLTSLKPLWELPSYPELFDPKVPELSWGTGLNKNKELTWTASWIDLPSPRTLCPLFYYAAPKHCSCGLSAPRHWSCGPLYCSCDLCYKFCSPVYWPCGLSGPTYWPCPGGLWCCYGSGLAWRRQTELPCCSEMPSKSHLWDTWT